MVISRIVRSIGFSMVGVEGPKSTGGVQYVSPECRGVCGLFKPDIPKVHGFFLWASRSLECTWCLRPGRRTETARARTVPAAIGIRLALFRDPVLWIDI